MALNDEVSSNSSCDDDESSNDLQEEYNNLFHEFKSLGSKYKILKKENASLVKQNKDLNLSCESLKNEKIILVSHVNALPDSRNTLKKEVQNLNSKLKGLHGITNAHSHAHAHSRVNFTSKSHSKNARSKNCRSHSHVHNRNATHVFNGNYFYYRMHGYKISNCMYRMDSKMGNAFWVPKLSNFEGPKAIWVSKTLPSSFVGGGPPCK